MYWEENVEQQDQEQSVKQSRIDESYWQALFEQGKYAPPLSWVIEQHEKQQQREGERKHSMTVGAPTRNTINEKQTENDWDALDILYNTNEILELPVIGYNRGGLLVKFNNTQGFVPISHLVNFPYFNDQQDLQQALEALVGRIMSLRVVELNPQRNRLILSAKAATRLPEEQEEWRKLRPGDIITGRITALRPFGAFVDIDGIEGLIHISELAWRRIGRPEDVVQVGQEVQVQVMEVDIPRKRIGLSLKRLQPDPWQEIEEKYSEGQEVEVTITNVMDFGAFAEVENGLEGLIHVSEMSAEPLTSPHNILQAGDRLRARIVQIDGRNHRLGLSLRQVEQNEPLPLPAERQEIKLAKL